MSNQRYAELESGYELPKIPLVTRVFRPKITTEEDLRKGLLAGDIHDDATAIHYGYRGGLVNGQLVFGYLARGLVAYFGSAWLASGRMEVHFLRPLYENDEILCSYRVTERQDSGDGEWVHMELTAHNGEGKQCALGSASFPLGGAPSLTREPSYVTGALGGDSRPIPPLMPGNVALNVPFKPRLIEDSSSENDAYVKRVGDPLPIYQRFVHPGLLTTWHGWILGEDGAQFDTHALGPIVQVSFSLEHFGPALAGCPYTAYGAFTQDYHRKRGDYHVVESAVYNESNSCVARAMVTTIYNLVRNT